MTLIEIQNDAELAQLAGYTSVYGSLAISNVTDLEALNCLTSVLQILQLWGNSVTDLEGLRNLRGNPTMRLSLGGNAIENVDGLRNVDSVWQLYINYNDALTNLDGLNPNISGSLTSADYIYIYDNSALPTCAAEALRDALVDNGFVGFANISDNDDAGTCN